MNRSTLSGWLPVVVFGTAIGSFFVLETFSPSLFCAPVNDGGKELTCGSGYAAPVVTTLTITFYVLFFGALALAARQALQSRLSKLGALGFGFSMLIVLLGIALSAKFSAGDSP
ncbi:hypothetical protein [Massilia sp. TS11]|uniref:hypothetical protein n=1 Tax=Massilia sp. TS11 TaxID=2908003 RepID=UPI001EDC9042|nr:hypothetical protein [Massilia sp. TS11]MCG2584144.1 hypothetical protein [Massilia sp. TS11]